MYFDEKVMNGEVSEDLVDCIKKIESGLKVILATNSCKWKC